jgi:hypothetical protein
MDSTSASPALPPMHRSAIVCDYPAPTAIDVKVGCSRRCQPHRASRPPRLGTDCAVSGHRHDLRLLRWRGMVWPRVSRLDGQQRGMRDDGARGRSKQRHGPAQPAGQGGNQHAMEDHQRSGGGHRHPPRAPPGQTRVAGTQQLQPNTGQGPEQSTEGDATGPAGGQPAPQKSG